MAEDGAQAMQSEQTWQQGVPEWGGKRYHVSQNGWVEQHLLLREL